MTTPVGGTGSGAHDEVLAGEYVLGALAPDMERVVAARLKTDRQFAAIVRRWQDNLTDVNDSEADPWLIAASSRISGAPSVVDLALPTRTLRHSFTLWRSVGITLLGLLAVYTIFTMQNPARTTTTASLPVVNATYDPVAARVGMDTATSVNTLSKIWIIDASNQAHLVGELPSNGFITLDDTMKRMMDQGATLAVAPAR